MTGLLICMVLFVKANSQPPADTVQTILGQEKIIPGVYLDFELDNLGNLFLVNTQQQIKKLSPALDSMGVFNDVRTYGRLHAIDVSNPLKVLLFYRDFGSIIILDRFLNVRTILNLRTAGIQQVSAITQSFDNNIWLYDELDNMVKKMDESGRILLQSPDFRVVFDDPPQPSCLTDFNRFLYAYDSVKGLLVMDYFGAYRELLPFKAWQHLHAISQGIAATDGEGLVYYTPGNALLKKQALPASLLARAQKIRVHNLGLYVLDKKGNLYRYQLP